MNGFIPAFQIGSSMGSTSAQPMTRCNRIYLGYDTEIRTYCNVMYEITKDPIYVILDKKFLDFVEKNPIEEFK